MCWVDCSGLNNLARYTDYVISTYIMTAKIHLYITDLGLDSDFTTQELCSLLRADFLLGKNKQDYLKKLL